MNHEVDRVASRQLSLITTGQMHETGMSAREIGRFHQQGAIERVRRGVYRLAGSPATWAQTVMAAVLAAGYGAVASHQTAAALRQFRHVDRDHAGLHLIVPGRARLPGVTGHSASLGRDEMTVCRGVPVTSAERTLIDLAGFLSYKELGECLDDALRRQLITLERLRCLVAPAAARGGRRKLEPVHRLLAERLPGYRPGANDWERDMDRQWDKLGLEPGRPQHRVTVNGHPYIIDRAIPELKIGVEFHGHEYHHLRSDRDRDAQRAAELAAAGWHIIPITSGTRPDTLRQAVSRAVDDRRRWMAAS